MTDDRQLWQEASERAWFCANCGQQHVGIFDLGFDAPAYWDRARTSGSGGLARVGENLLSDDFCVVGGEHYFVRTVLEISIVGVKEAQFGYGIWSSLSKANFELYRDTFDDGDQDRLGPWFGWFANELPGYPSTLSLRCNVLPRNGRQRPLLELQPTEHALALEQREGITLERLFEIYAIHGHAPAKTSWKE